MTWYTCLPNIIKISQRVRIKVIEWTRFLFKILSRERTRKWRESTHFYMWHAALTWYTCLPNIIILSPRVLKVWSEQAFIYRRTDARDNEQKLPKMVYIIPNVLVLHFGEKFMKNWTKIAKSQMHENLNKHMNENMFSFTCLCKFSWVFTKGN